MALTWPEIPCHQMDSCILRDFHNREEQCIKIVLSGFLRQDRPWHEFPGNPHFSSKAHTSAEALQGLSAALLLLQNLHSSCNPQSCPVTPRNWESCYSHSPPQSHSPSAQSLGPSHWALQGRSVGAAPHRTASGGTCGPGRGKGGFN